MEYIYIDESGLLTQAHAEHFPYQVLALVRVFNVPTLKQVMKRFVSENLEKLRELDHEHRMFRGNDFLELKGSALDHKMKEKLLRYLCRNNYFEVYYIKIVNNRVKGPLYSNKARATNYILTLAMKYFLQHGYLPMDEYCLQIDEQNIKTESRNVLVEHLNMTLAMDASLASSFRIDYFDSARNKLVQLADIFANFYYSELMTGQYTELFEELRKESYIKFEFVFPLN